MLSQLGPQNPVSRSARTVSVDADLSHAGGRLCSGGHVTGVHAGLTEILQVEFTEGVLPNLPTRLGQNQRPGMLILASAARG